jgi:hypothetical protein
MYKKKEQKKPELWEVKFWKQGKDEITEDLWKREYYVVNYQTRDGIITSSVRHYNYINHFIKTLQDDPRVVDFRWFGCGNKKHAYDSKEMFQIYYATKVDRKHQEWVKEWK